MMRVLNAVRPRLVTFDAFKTLVGLRGGSSVDTYLKLVQGEFGIKLEKSIFVPHYIRCMNQQKLELPRYGIDKGYSVVEWWKRFVGDALETSIRDSDFRKEIATFLTLELRKVDQWRCLDGVIDLLHQLSEAHVMMGVVSNCDDRLPGILDELGIRQYFQFVHTSVNTHFEKPDVRAFELALKTVHFGSPQDVVHIGDQLIEDYIAPRRTGIRSILISCDPRTSAIESRVCSIGQLIDSDFLEAMIDSD